MNVARILATKGKVVHTIAPHRTLLEAARSLGEKRIGALIVGWKHSWYPLRARYCACAHCGRWRTR